MNKTPISTIGDIVYILLHAHVIVLIIKSNKCIICNPRI